MDSVKTLPAGSRVLGLFRLPAVGPGRRPAGSLLRTCTSAPLRGAHAHCPQPRWLPVLRGCRRLWPRRGWTPQSSWLGVHGWGLHPCEPAAVRARFARAGGVGSGDPRALPRRLPEACGWLRRWRRPGPAVCITLSLSAEAWGIVRPRGSGVLRFPRVSCWAGSSWLRRSLGRRRGEDPTREAAGEQPGQGEARALGHISDTWKGKSSVCSLGSVLDLPSQRCAGLE